MRNKQMEMNTCKFYALSKFRLKNRTFSWFREFAPPIEKLPLFSPKMGTSMVYALFGSAGAGVGVYKYTSRTDGSFSSMPKEFE